MARSHRANGKDRRRLVRVVVEVLAKGEPTLFRWEAKCRYTLRTALCLQGNSWPLSDSIAADVVARALHFLNVERPPWVWGQREYTWDTSSTMVWFSHCLECGSRLLDGQQKFCGSACGNRYRQAFLSEEVRERARENSLAYLRDRRDRSSPLQCEACCAWFRPSRPEHRFCCRQCSGGRSVVQKMNGKHHPWMNRKKTGAGAANGVAVSLENTGKHDGSTAPLNASAGDTTSLSHASAPPPGSTSGALSAESGSKPNGRTGCIAA